MHRCLKLVAAIACLMAPAAKAQDAAPPPAATAASDPVPAITTHSGVFNGQRIDYRAVAGNMIVHDKAGRPTASIFSVAYLAGGKSASKDRPVTFLFNGGPGSASFWIQMGALGPKIVELKGPDAVDIANPVHRIIDNPDALLDVTDLVFIDPVGTAYSHALSGGKDSEFYKTSTDAGSIYDFIQEWLTVNHRWNSPRFVGGESYGSIRTALIVGKDPWMTFNGAILISQGLDWGTVIMPRGYDLGYQQFLPSYAAAAWYYRVVPQTMSLSAYVQQASAFAYSDYAAALAKGPSLSDTERDVMAERLANLTGIAKAVWIANDLRVPPDQFRRTLLAGRNLRLGRFDARFSTRVESVFDVDEHFDPSLSTAALPYLEAMRAYLTDDLKVDRVTPYRAVTDGDWTYDLDNDAFLNPAPHLGDAMRANPAMKLFVASGYYDFSSPVASAFYNIGHAGVPMSRTTMKYYETGHMMYVAPDGRRALINDMRRFIVDALPPRSGASGQ